jgi:hypothetical protein
MNQPVNRILKALSQHVIPQTNSLSDFANDRRKIVRDKIFLADKIEIRYNEEMEGGGTTFGQEFHNVLAELYPNHKFNAAFEWCSGPGFIGFDLLSRDFCQHLYLSDVFRPSLASVRETVENNKEICQDRVSFCHSQSVSQLPDDWKFDLIIGNPPHWDPNSLQFITKINFNCRIAADLDWQIHLDFFQNIKKYMNPGATILLLEQAFGSDPDCFRNMIEDNGLRINEVYWQPADDQFYYLEVKSA